mmetsp:Transcript_11129/g.28225  ORF Transcript_11129/g.28225 Transcript_11129/m.28225 type:complete len:218 (-) Transcript_11129:220-873(-)
MAVSSPAAMNAILSDRSSASSMKWVDRRIARFFRWVLSRDQISRRLFASTPAVGSSRTTSCDPPPKAIPMLNFRFIPPLREEVAAFRFGVKPTAVMAESISPRSCDDGTPFSRRNISRCSSTVKTSYKALDCKQTPTGVRNFRSVCATSTDPSDGDKIPVMMDIVVDLPAPLCPKNPVIASKCISNVTPRRATFPLAYVFFRPLMRANTCDSDSAGS